VNHRTGKAVPANALSDWTDVIGGFVENEIKAEVKELIDPFEIKAHEARADVNLLRHSSMRAKPTKNPKGPKPPLAAKSQALVSNVKQMRQRAPVVTGNKYAADGSVTVLYREYLGDIYGSVGFTTQQWALNPGLSHFRWLHRIASEFDFYRFEEVKLTYATDTGTSTNGSVFVALDYNASDEPPSSRGAIMDYAGATRNATWANFDYTANAASLNAFSKCRYVRQAGVPPNTDVKTYDAANIYVCTSGQTDDAAIGEVYITYKVRFSAPHINTRAISRASVGFYTWAGILDPPSASPGHPMGDPLQIVRTGGGIDVRFADTTTQASLSDGSYFLPVNNGYYYVIWELSGTGLNSFGLDTLAGADPCCQILEQGPIHSNGTYFAGWAYVLVTAASTPDMQTALKVAGNSWTTCTGAHISIMHGAR